MLTLVFAELAVVPSAFAVSRPAPFESCISFQPKDDSTQNANRPSCTCHFRLFEHTPQDCASAYPTWPVDQGLERSPGPVSGLGGYADQATRTDAILSIPEQGRQ